VIYKLLPREHQCVVTADCRNRSLQRRTPGTGFRATFVLFDEIPGSKRGYLVGPFDDPITILDLDASAGVQVQDETSGRDLCLGGRGNRKQENDS
jgi:hypothetical protein